MEKLALAGIDVGAKELIVALDRGRETRIETFPNDAEEQRRLVRALGRGKRRCRVVVEATGHLQPRREPGPPSRRTDRGDGGEPSRALPPDVQRRAHRKLLLVNAAERIDDLRVPPGNRLERLRGDRKGQYSIRVNDQWRVCFRWSGGDAFDVEITDYH